MSENSPATGPIVEVAARPLQEDRPEWGSVLIIPWDTEIFGFPVGAFQPGDAQAVAENREAFRSRLREWTATHQVELLACTLEARDRAWQLLMPELGFVWIEQTLRATGRLHRFEAPLPLRTVRLATPEDRPQVEEIAGHVFRHGRYHADPRFPVDLADRRYRHWIRNAASDPTGRVYVIGDSGNIKGFFQVKVKGNRAEAGIMAMSAAAQGSTASSELATGAQLHLKADGYRWIDIKVSTTNVRMLNLAADFGYRYRDPEVTFHWHAPDARHLRPREEPPPR